MGDIMKFNRAITFGLVTLAFATAQANAFDGRNPGSLLVYPEFDNRAGIVTIVTVTNVHTEEIAGTTDVEFVYIGKYGVKGNDLGCSEFNRTETLTGGDTLTVITNSHNNDQEQGYLYVFAKEGDDPSVFNHLIGNVMTVHGLSAFEFSVNPIPYTGIGDGHLTDVDEDELLDMNGCEYESNPDEILIPRFLGQGAGFNSELILIAFSGGIDFATTIDFLIFNDNEEVFSSEHTFSCWQRIRLLSISGIFENDFLQNYTGHDPAEYIGPFPGWEAGWMRMTGAVASSSSLSIEFPSFYAVLVEKIGHRGAADLPFTIGSRNTGELLAQGPRGDEIDCP